MSEAISEGKVPRAGTPRFRRILVKKTEIPGWLIVTSRHALKENNDLFFSRSQCDPTGGVHPQFDRVRPPPWPNAWASTGDHPKPWRAPCPLPRKIPPQGLKTKSRPRWRGTPPRSICPWRWPLRRFSKTSAVWPWPVIPSPELKDKLEAYINGNTEGLWENSWVQFPEERLSPYQPHDLGGRPEGGQGGSPQSTAPRCGALPVPAPRVRILSGSPSAIS